MSPTSAVFGWAILIATFFGPICAVICTRYVDSLRDQRQRRLHLFRVLMGTRRSLLSSEHTGALNLIEIDFHGKSAVIDAWKGYFRNLSTPIDDKNLQQVIKERQTLFAKLLSEMAKVLDIKIEQLDMLDSGYLPQAVADLENQQAAIRKLFSEISAGSRALPITLYPPPKEKE